MAVFYRKYRPQKLAEIVGQDHITKTLASQLEKGKISHAYLFAGPKGSGKTTTARILAKAVNCQGSKETKDKKTFNASGTFVIFSEPCDQCGSCQAILNERHLDVIEIDAASNRGIDDIRNLREKIKLAPVSGRYKVYIVDEVHMLTNEAFNALLKTLEEPPEHAIFVLCTTQVEKLPDTIVSRCQRFDFRKAQDKEIVELLKNIVAKEGLDIRDDLLLKIAKRADGSFRDALSFLNQLAFWDQSDNVGIDNILSDAGPATVADFTQYLIEEDAKGAILALSSLVAKGVDLKVFLTDLLSWLRCLLLYKEGADEILKTWQFSPDIYQTLVNQAKSVSRQKNLEFLKSFNIASQEIRHAPISQLPIEMAIVSVCSERNEDGENKTKKIKGDETQNQLEDARRIKTSLERQEIQKEDVTFNPSSQLTIEKINNHWLLILEKVRARSSSLATIFSRCSPRQLDNGRLILDTSFKFHKEKLEEKGSLYLIERTLSDFFGQPIKVEFFLKGKDLT